MRKVFVCLLVLLVLALCVAPVAANGVRVRSFGHGHHGSFGVRGFGHCAGTSGFGYNSFGSCGYGGAALFAPYSFAVPYVQTVAVPYAVPVPVPVPVAVPQAVPVPVPQAEAVPLAAPGYSAFGLGSYGLGSYGLGAYGVGSYGTCGVGVSGCLGATFVRARNFGHHGHHHGFANRAGPVVRGRGR